MDDEWMINADGSFQSVKWPYSRCKGNNRPGRRRRGMEQGGSYSVLYPGRNSWQGWMAGLRQGKRGCLPEGTPPVCESEKFSLSLGKAWI